MTDFEVNSTGTHNLIEQQAARIEELERDYAKAQHTIGKYVDLTAKLERVREAANKIAHRDPSPEGQDLRNALRAAGEDKD